MTPETPPEQLNFDLCGNAADGGTSASGLDRWQAERRQALESLGRKLGFPLGHQAEVRLHDGTVLRGVLSLAEPGLFIEQQPDFHLQLRVDRCTFTPADIESAVRL